MSTSDGIKAPHDPAQSLHPSMAPERAGAPGGGTDLTRPVEGESVAALRADPTVAVLRSVDRAASGFLHGMRKVQFPHFRKPRLRLLPTLIFVALLMLVGRANHFQHGLGDLGRLDAGVPAQAESSAESEREAEVQVASVSSPHENAEAEEEPAHDGAAAEPVPAPSESEPFNPASLSGSEVRVLQALSERRQDLDARERRLQEQEALLAVAEQRVEEKITELEALRTEIQDFLGAADEQQDVQLASLVRIYEAMRPSDASAIFDGLEMDVLLNVLERMSERKSAPIIAGMNPQRAREVTTELALRRRMPTAPDGLLTGTD